jgi:leucyl/phenylalanyl-tRNA--protein transferase
MPVYMLTDELVFPPPHLSTKEGLLAMGGDLRPERLILAYKCGIFPWYSDGDPILWWSPDPRMVLFPDQIRISRSLKKNFRRNTYQITMNTCFRKVIASCAKTPRRGMSGTWITADMQAAYRTLHELGYAHSVETWFDKKLVGGLYGISLGPCFFGESMFSIMNDASKAALVHLCEYLQHKDFDFIDCQLPTDHLIRMGAKTMSREHFISMLTSSLGRSHPGAFFREPVSSMNLSHQPARRSGG